MTKSVILICAGATRSSRVGGFGDPSESLDESGRRAAARLSIETRFRDHVLCSPSRSARETANAMGLEAQDDGALSDMDHGSWTGRSFEDIHQSDPQEFMRWIGDPVQGSPGGETMEMLSSRLAPWLHTAAASDQPLCAITHAMTIRCILACAITLPLSATLAIDIAPLARVRLSYNRIWRLQAIEPNDRNS